MTDRDRRDDERLAYLCGWLDGFSGTVWALMSNQKGSEVVADEMAVEYDQKVAELRELLGVGQ